jgi:hypothetical protein
MLRTTKTKTGKGWLYVLISILIFGSLWGLSEVAIGGGLKAANFPYRSGLLTGIAMGIMGASLAFSWKPLKLLGIGLVAVGVSLLVVPVLHVSPVCKANSCLALVIESGSLTLGAFALGNKISKNVYAQMATGFTAALVASTAFYFAGSHFAPCAYLLSFTPGSFIVKEGVVWAVFSSVLFPIGYAIGKRLADSSSPVLAERRLYYSSSAVLLSACWTISALVIAAGF